MSQTTSATTGRRYGLERVCRLWEQSRSAFYARRARPQVHAFDRYFVLATPEGDLSEAELSRLLSSVSDRERFRAELRALAEKGLLGVALDRMEAYKQRIDVAHALPLVTAG